jgi:hypothetical protein
MGRRRGHGGRENREQEKTQGQARHFKKFPMTEDDDELGGGRTKCTYACCRAGRNPDMSFRALNQEAAI